MKVKVKQQYLWQFIKFNLAGPSRLTFLMEIMLTTVILLKYFINDFHV